MGAITKILIAALSLIAGSLALVLPAQGVDSIVSGTVSSSTGPVDSGAVYFYATCQEYYDDDSVAWNDFTGGTYSVNVPDGAYRVRVFPDIQPEAVTSWHNAKPGCPQADVVTVLGNTVINLVAATGSLVSGTVQAPGGTVSRGALAWYSSCEEYYARPGWPATFTGGAYSDHLADGTYRVLFYNEVTEYPNSYATKSWHAAKPSCSQAQQVTVSGDTVVNISVAAGKAVSGTVSSSNGPVTSGSVFFYTTCEDVVSGEYPGYSEITNGTYTDDAVPPGTYRIRIKPTTDGAIESWNHAKATCETADPVTISSDGTVNLVAQTSANPTPLPTTDPTIEPLKQTAKKPPSKVKKGKKVKFATKTAQGARITWKSRSKTVCTMRGSTVTAKKKGMCKVKAKAPAVPGYLTYAKVFTVRITSAR
jgi:hypothetical protein